MRVAVLDSGVHWGHPHIGALAGGFNAVEGADPAQWQDELGHGTAVVAAIQDLAPGAEILVVKIFQRQLRTDMATLARGYEWAMGQGAELINLSLGTTEAAHCDVLRELMAKGGTWISAAQDQGHIFYPGALAGAVGVVADAALERNQIRRTAEGYYAASPFPRSIPGVPRERNLRGISFAVANLTGCLAQGQRLPLSPAE